MGNEKIIVWEKMVFAQLFSRFWKFLKKISGGESKKLQNQSVFSRFWKFPKSEITNSSAQAALKNQRIFRSPECPFGAPVLAEEPPVGPGEEPFEGTGVWLRESGSG